MPLDDLDRRLLNLMQGSFPIAARPYARVGRSWAEIAEAEVMSRVQRLLDKRIIRQVTPIFDTRALGYSSMLVAAKVDPEHPHRAAQVINAASRRLAQLPAQPRVQPVVHDRHRARLRARPGGHARGARARGGGRVGAPAADAEAVQDPHGPRDGGRHEGARERRARRSEPIELEPQPYDELDIAVIRALQGDMPVIEEPYAPAAAELGYDARSACSTTSRGCRSAGCCAAWRRSSTTAARASRRTGWASGRCPTSRSSRSAARMASVRGISHCYQRPTYEDWPYSVFTMAHGRSKEECDAVLDAIAEQTGIHERATLYSSTEFKKIRLLYFTEDFKDWEQRTRWMSARSSSATAGWPMTALTDTRSAELYRARARADPRRGQLARARDALDRPRPDLHRPRRGRRADRRRRQPLHRLRLLVGSADPRARPPAGAAGRRRGGGEGHELRRADRRRGRAGGRGGARGCEAWRCCA